MRKDLTTEKPLERLPLADLHSHMGAAGMIGDKKIEKERKERGISIEKNTAAKKKKS